MAGHKTWAVGEEVLAADWGPYISDQIVAVFASAAARASGWTSPPTGAWSTLLDSPGALWHFNGTAWVERSATLFCTSSTRPTGTQLYTGLRIFETDTQREYVYDGAAFQPSGAVARSWVVLADVNLAADGPISFAAIPQTYTHLQIVASLKASTAAVTDSVMLRCNSDAGANYFDGQVLGASSPASVTAGGGARTGGAICGPCSANTGVRLSSHVIDIPTYTQTTFDKVGNARAGVAEAAIGYESMNTWAWLNHGAITQLDLVTATTVTWKTGSRATLLAIR